MSFHRQEKLASIYQEVVSVFLERELKVQDGIFSVTGVEVGEKLDRVKIYFSVWPDREEKNVLKSLEDLKKELRAHLAEKVKTKFVPEIEFRLDESEKRRLEIEKLLKKNK